MKNLSKQFSFLAVCLLNVILFINVILFTPATKALAQSPVRINEKLTVGKTLSLNLGQAGWKLAGSNNTGIISAQINGENFFIKALNPGLATAFACPENLIDPAICAYVTITVNPENVLGLNTGAAYKPHSAGLFVNVGQTVFYVHEHGLIPITTYPIFLSVAPKNVAIYPANDYDMQLPLLPYMETNDQRVQR